MKIMNIYNITRSFKSLDLITYTYEHPIHGIITDQTYFKDAPSNLKSIINFIPDKTFAVINKFNKIELVVNKNYINYMNRGAVEFSDDQLFADVTEISNNNILKSKTSHYMGNEYEKCIYDSIYITNDGFVEINSKDFLSHVNIAKQPKPPLTYITGKEISEIFKVDTINLPTPGSAELFFNMHHSDEWSFKPIIIDKSHICGTFDESIRKTVETKISKSKKNILCWSGGIDSTFLYYVLKDSGIDFDVILSDESRLEYPMLYEYIIANHNCRDMTKFKEYDWSDYWIITGEMGGQLFGGMSGGKTIQNEKVFGMKWREYFDIDKMNETDIYIQNILSEFININELTVHQYVSLEHIFKARNKMISRFTDYLGNANYPLSHFFDSPFLKVWTILNIEKVLTNSKSVLKDYIYEKNKDLDYFKYKTKVYSLRPELIGNTMFAIG